MKITGKRARRLARRMASSRTKLLRGHESGAVRVASISIMWDPAARRPVAGVAGKGARHRKGAFVFVREEVRGG